MARGGSLTRHRSVSPWNLGEAAIDDAASAGYYCVFVICKKCIGSRCSGLADATPRHVVVPLDALMTDAMG
jgi:hypothetical protein